MENLGGKIDNLSGKVDNLSGKMDEVNENLGGKIKSETKIPCCEPAQTNNSRCKLFAVSSGKFSSSQC